MVAVCWDIGSETSNCAKGGLSDCQLLLKDVTPVTSQKHCTLFRNALSSRHNLKNVMFCFRFLTSTF
jgi:hypothetical protein